MTSKVIRVGRGRLQTEQVVTTTYSTEPGGDVREHVTLETPKEITETQKLRLMSYTEAKRSWKD